MATENRRAQDIAAAGSRYFPRFEEDTLRERRLPIRVIIEFLGTFMLVTVVVGRRPSGKPPRAVTCTSHDPRNGRRWPQAPGLCDRSGRTRRGNI